MKSILFAFIFSAAMLSSVVYGEELQLKDGTKVSGKLISVSGDIFRVKTAYGEIEIPRSQLVSVTFPENESKTAGGAESSQSAPEVEESLQGTTYTNRTAGFQVTVPQGWKLATELRKQTSDIIAALQSEDGTLFFFVTPEKFAGNLSTYRVLAETQYQMKFKDYEKLSESDIKLDGRPGARMVWHAKNPAANDAPIKAIVYFIPYDGRMVRLSFLTLEPLFNDSLPIFEKIAGSYHSINPTKQAAKSGDFKGALVSSLGDRF